MQPGHARKIPKREVLEFILRSVLKGRTAHSQRELAELVNSRLAANDPGYVVSPRRVRMAAVSAGARLSVRTRKGRMPSGCPVCGHRVRKTYMRNLKGGKAVSGAVCARCGYQGKAGKALPGRYEFRM